MLARIAMEDSASGYEVVKQFTAAEGREVLSIIRAGQLFRFIQERWTHSQEIEEVFDAFDYWDEVQSSGFYETAEAAERDALLSAPQFCTGLVE